MLILKNFIDDTIPSRNFELQNKQKKGSIVNKRLFLPKFSEFKFPHERLSCVKKWNLKAIRLN